MSVTRKHPLADCQNCPLRDKAYVPTIGPKDAEYAVVSRSPGHYEKNAGKPFSGPSGKVLNHLLERYGLKREEVLLTNTVLCVPDAGKVPPTAIKACSKRLWADVCNADTVIAAGSEAVNELIGRGSIDKYRGYRIERANADSGVTQTFVATNNPALVLRDDSTFPNLVKDFKRAIDPIPVPPFPKVEVIEDGRTARNLLRAIDPCNTVSGDIESRGGLTHRARIVCYQWSVDGTVGYVLSESLCSDGNFVKSVIGEHLERTDIDHLWWNGKFDVEILRYGYGIHARIDHDGMLLNYACDERGGIHELEYCLAEEFGWPDYTPKSVKIFKKTGVVEDAAGLYRYAGLDAAGTRQLFDVLYDRAELDGVLEPYRLLLIPGCEPIMAMETNGMVYDVEAAADVQDNELGPELRNIKRGLQKLIDNPIYNPKSTKQTSALYYDTWQVRHEMTKRPDKKRSCDDAMREEILAGRYRIPDEIVALAKGFPPSNPLWALVKEKRGLIQVFTKDLHRYAKIQKQSSTYIVGLIERAILDPESRIYTSLWFHNTVTGRLSSRDPNLQNITRDKDDLPSIRSLFRCSPGRLLVQADYSQAELRVIASLSDDVKLTKIYREGLDLHDICAENFYGKDFTYEQRSNAKNMNFGTAYRQSAKTFQEKHGVNEKEAARYIKWWFNEFKGVSDWEESIESLVHNPGNIVSPFGRKRRFYLITSDNREAAYREAINFLPQSTASDFTLTACIKLQQEIDHKRASLVLTVHDSIIADVDESYIEDYAVTCKQIMESRPKEELGWTLPFLADIAVGDSWGSVSDY